MRDKFNEQLEQLNVELIRMGALCEEGISAATKAMLDQDASLRETAAAAEREIDQKERDIENLCMKLLLQQQPVAGDLRAISAALKMISDMERIGDQAADIAEVQLHEVLIVVVVFVVVHLFGAGRQRSQAQDATEECIQFHSSSCLKGLKTYLQSHDQALVQRVGG